MGGKFGSGRKLTIAEAKNFCNNKNITMLDDYKTMNTKNNFKCNKCGWKWKTIFSTLYYRNSGCAKCSGILSPTKKEINKVLLKKNIIILEDYKNARYKHKFQCLTCGYKFQTNYDNIKRKTGCKKCAGKLKHTYQEIVNFCKTRNIEYLSKRYTNLLEIDKFKCIKCGYIWETSCGNVYSKKSNCSACSSYKDEKECRKIFKEIFNKEFFPIRPKWLMGLKNKPLELDGYCEELKLAFEYNGEQHYKKSFNYSLEKFKELQNRDKLKQKICKTLGIKLIIIPYYVENKKEFILNSLKDSIINN